MLTEKQNICISQSIYILTGWGRVGIIYKRSGEKQIQIPVLAYAGALPLMVVMYAVVTVRCLNLTTTFTSGVFNHFHSMITNRVFTTTTATSSVGTGGPSAAGCCL